MHPVLVGNVVGNHPFVYKIQPAHIHAGVARPDYLRLEIVCMALNHRIHSSKDPAYAQSLAPTYYHFRGLILRSLNAAMANEKTRKKYINFLMAGILSLLLADVGHQHPLQRSILTSTGPSGNLTALAIPPARNPAADRTPRRLAGPGRSWRGAYPALLRIVRIPLYCSSF